MIIMINIAVEIDIRINIRLICLFVFNFILIVLIYSIVNPKIIKKLFKNNIFTHKYKYNLRYALIVLCFFIDNIPILIGKFNDLKCQKFHGFMKFLW